MWIYKVTPCNIIIAFKMGFDVYFIYSFSRATILKDPLVIFKDCYDLKRSHNLSSIFTIH